MENIGKSPLLTVVVPVYNGERYLGETIEYILHSDYQNIEILLIDDGSTDKSSVICRQFQEQDERVRVVQTENGGIVAARNKGLALAKGDYICFCDQDDIVEPFMYAYLLEKMVACDAQIGMCCTGRMMDGKKSVYEKLADGTYDREDITEYLLYPLLFRGYEYPFVKQDNYLYGTIWKCIYNRSFLMKQNMQFRSFVNYEDDWLFVTETLAKSDKVVTGSRIGYYWRVNTESKSHKTQFMPDMLCRFEALDDYVFACLNGRGIDSGIVKEYKKIAMCEHYVEGFQNEAYSRGEKQKYRKELKDYLVQSNYRENIQCAGRLKNSALKRKLLCVFLKYSGIHVTFVLYRGLLWLIEKADRVQWIVVLERKAKMKKQQEAVR